MSCKSVMMYQSFPRSSTCREACFGQSIKYKSQMILHTALEVSRTPVARTPPDHFLCTIFKGKSFFHVAPEGCVSSRIEKDPASCRAISGPKSPKKGEKSLLGSPARGLQSLKRVKNE